MNRIMALTQSLVNRYHTRDPFLLCAELEIHILFADLPDTVQGFYQLIDGHKFIYLNNLLDENQMRVICTHELAHALMHSDYNVLELLRDTFFCCPRYEHEADMFCAYLLIDRDEAESASPGLVCAEQIASLSGVPVELVDLCYTQNP
ncbi:MAG: ImmA/IrrE family metallo-endopeptidase [Acetanaerobacterium sp.]